MKGTKKGSLALSLITLIFTAGFIANLNAQDNFWESKSAYLAQKPPGDTPRIFADGILADSGIVLGRVAFSKNGKEFYYGFARHWFDFNGTGVKKIVFDGKKWGRPEVLIEDLAIPTLSIDETKLFFGGRNSEIWQSERINNVWSAPKRWLNKNYGLYNFQPTNSGVFYVGSNANSGNKNDYNSYDFCTLTISNTDTVIKSLGIPLNTPAFDGDFYVAPDESYMIISAKETKTYECELYVSFRKADKTWTSPKSLGADINDGIAHRFGQLVSPDGKYLFYTKGTSEKDCNYYWVRIDHLLKKLKKTNYEPYLKNPINDYEAKLSQPFSFQIPDSTFFDDDGSKTLRYSATLGDGTNLPAWLKFNPFTKTLSCKRGEKGKHTIKIIVTDVTNATISCTFSLNVNDI